MTQQTAIANLKKNALNILYNTVLKEEGGVCAKSNLSTLKSKIKGTYNHLFTSCANQELICEELNDNALTICTPTIINCSSILNTTTPIVYSYTGSTPVSYLFSLPFESNVTYTWSTDSTEFLLNSTSNTCVAETISGSDACEKAIVINCLIRDTTYGCIVLKTLSLGITC